MSALPTRRRLPSAVQQIPRPSVLPDYLEKEEVDRLITAARNPRARLLMLLQWRAGLRVSEALALTPGDLHLDGDRPTLLVRRGKGGKGRFVPIHPELRAALSTALNYSNIPKDRPIIQASRSTAWRWIREAYARCAELGLLPPGRRISTHTLRHSAARHWLASGVPINIVSRWLGHASIQTTLIYLELLPDPAGNIERVP